jgi:ribonuclease BN (tRNA processing enzyme)
MTEISSIKATVLGCAGSTFVENSPTPYSSYLVHTGNTSILLDCGFGSFQSFEGLAKDTKLWAIFVSHAHADHVADLESFIDASEIWNTTPRLIASQETMNYIIPDPTQIPEDFLSIVSPGAPLVIGDITMTFSLTTHKMPTLATKLNNVDSSLIYCADTGPDWQPPRDFQGGNFAIIESTIEVRNPDSSNFHLDATEAGLLARDLGAKSTLISHIPPIENGASRLKLAQSVASGQNLTLAYVGLEMR